MEDNKEQLKKLARVFNADKIVTPEDIAEVLKGVLNIVNSFKKSSEKLNSETTSMVENLLNKVMAEHDKMKADVTRETSDTKEEVNKKLEESITQMKKMCEEMMLSKPKDGEDADHDLIVADVLSKIEIPQPKEIVLDNAEQIAEKLNSQEELIDQKVIKGLTKKISDISLNIAHNSVREGAKLYTGVSETRVRELIDLLAGSSGGSGTVTSVAMTVPTGLTISGSPVTTTGTLAVALDTGYVIPLQTTLDAKLDGNGTATYVPYYSDANTLASEAHFNYNATTHVLHVHALAGDATDGLLLESDNGTDIAILGAANTANGTWYGNHNFEGGTLQIGKNTTTLGKITLFGNTSGSVTIQPNAVAGSGIVLTAPATTGTIALTSDIPAAGANTALSNLASVAINTTLVSDTDNTDALGTSAIAWSDLFLGSGGVITWNSAPSTPDITLTHSADTLTLAGGNFALGTNSLTLTGSIGATGARATKVWTADLESTNMPTVGGVAMLTISSSDTLSNKTLTAPKFVDLGYIADANGNELVIFDTVTSAVNEITLANGATGNNPKFTASGGDANVGFDFQAKGTGTYRLLGTADQAAELRLYEDTTDGTNYTAFKVGTQSGDVTYTLPTAAPAVNGYALTSTTAGVMSWASAGGTSVTVQTPQPTQGVDGGLIGIVYNSNTTGYTMSYDLPFGITVTSIDIRASGAAATPGTVDIGIYSEDGQTKHIDVTSGTINASAVYHIAVSSVTLSAGRYYLVLVPNGTASVELNAWDIVGVNFGDTGEPVLCGTQTVTASTLPTTFNPSSAVTFSNSSYGPLIRLNA